MSHLRQVSFSLAPESLWRMLIYYLPFPAYFFRHLGPVAWIIYGIQIILVVLSLLAHWKRDLPLAVYMLGTVVMYLAFPYQQGVRYVYPIWPVLLIFTLDGMHVAAERSEPVRSRQILTFLRFLWIAIAVSSLVISTRSAWLNMANDRRPPGRTWGAFSPGSTALFEFISDHTPADSVIIFYKPRALSLRTNCGSFPDHRLRRTCLRVIMWSPWKATAPTIRSRLNWFRTATRPLFSRQSTRRIYSLCTRSSRYTSGDPDSAMHNRLQSVLQRGLHAPLGAWMLPVFAVAYLLLLRPASVLLVRRHASSINTFLLWFPLGQT